MAEQDVRDSLLAVGQDLARLGSWRLDLRSGETVWSDGMYQLLGLEVGSGALSQEAVLKAIHPDDRGRLEAMLATIAAAPEEVPEDGLTAEFRVVHVDGAVRDWRARGRVERDERGKPASWVGVVQDVTELRLRERELEAHHGVRWALLEWESFDEGVVDLLRRLSSALAYPMASLWLWDESRARLVCRAFWSAPNADPGHYFEHAKRSLTFRPGEGKPGCAWQTQGVVVTADAATDPVFEPHEAAILRGVCSGLAFPALSEDGPVTVLSFYSFEHRVPDASLIRTLTDIGHELGRFFQRRRAEFDRRPLSQRETEILRMAAEGKSGPAIAEKLFLSPSTVKTHFENIYEKLGVGDRAAAVAQALRSRVIE